MFISEELTAHFRGEPQAVHVLCFGISPEDHELLAASQPATSRNVPSTSTRTRSSARSHTRSTPSALRCAHATVGALAELFTVWETRNGSRAPELNMPASIYVETNGGTAIGGSDDHAGVDIGRTFTVAPPAGTPAELLEHIRAVASQPGGEQGSAEKWAHAAMALAVRALGRDGEVAKLDPVTVLKIAERLLREGDRSRGRRVGGPRVRRTLARCFGRGSSRSVSTTSPRTISSPTCRTSASRTPGLRGAHAAPTSAGCAAPSIGAFDAAGRGELGGDRRDALRRVPAGDPLRAVGGVHRARARQAREPRRRAAAVAIVADGIGAMHGVTRTIEEIRDRGIAGFEIEVIGTDPNVDRRLPAVADVEIPYYPGMSIGVPSLPAAVEAITAGRYDLIHVCSPGPSGVAAVLVARAMEIPLVGHYHTELASYAGLRSGDAVARDAAASGPRRVLRAVPPRALAEQLGRRRARGPRDRARARCPLGPWRRRLALRSSRGAARRPGASVSTSSTRAASAQEKNIDLLADAFELARARDPRLHLVIAGGGPEAAAAARTARRASATLLGWLDGDAARRRLRERRHLLLREQTDTFGQVVLEAQASGLAGRSRSTPVARAS